MRFFIAYCLWALSFGGFAQTTTGTFTNKTANIHYKIFGEKGKPVFVINGGPGLSSNYLNDFARQLSSDEKNHFRVILFDQRGTGQSTVPAFTKYTINIPNTIEDIRLLQDSLQLKKMHIIGHAYGGALAMLYASKYPNSVDKVILSSSVGMNLDYVEPMQASLKLRLNAQTEKKLRDLNQANQEGTIKTREYHNQRLDLITDALVYDKSKLDIAHDMYKLPNDFVFEVNQIIWDEMKQRQFDISKELKAYKGEVLLIHGRQDVIGESVPIIMHMTLPNSKLIFINEACRFLWIDQPGEYFHQIHEFLK